jgi:hypothetical protein
MSGREDGLNALAGRHDAASDPEPHAVSKEIAHRAAWAVNRGLVADRRIEPGAVHPGDHV